MRINKGQFRLTSRKKNIKFDLNRSKGHLIAFLSNRIKWHYYPRLNHVNKFPLHIDLEFQVPVIYTVLCVTQQLMNSNQRLIENL